MSDYRTYASVPDGTPATQDNGCARLGHAPLEHRARGEVDLHQTPDIPASKLMSVRAIYQIALPFGGRVTLRIHLDGSPEGAARHFLAAHLSSARGSLAERFIRANEHAEIVSAHDAGGHAEYRYAVTPDGLLIAEHCSPGSAFAVCFTGHYCEFINRYAPDAGLKLVKISRWCEAEWVTRRQLEARRAESIAALQAYRERHPGMADDITYHETVVVQLSLALAAYDGVAAANNNPRSSVIGASDL